jgi:hypothetical protein
MLSQRIMTTHRSLIATERALPDWFLVEERKVDKRIIGNTLMLSPERKKETHLGVHIQICFERTIGAIQIFL